MEHFASVLRPRGQRPGADLTLTSPGEAEKARRFHSGLPGYAPTPLVSLDGLAHSLGVSKIWIKDESKRFGLNAFKALGGSYAMARCLSEKLGKPLEEMSFEELCAPAARRALGDITFVTATDGNHGRGVAWAARLLGQKAVVYMPKGSAAERLENIRAQGAQAEITEYNYDDAVRLANRMAEEHGWILIQDTAWPGYEEIPAHIMQGYTTLAAETLQQLEEQGAERPTHLFLQAGVGSFAGAALGFFTSVWGEERPVTAIVEPDRADCLFRTAQADDGALHFVTGDMDSMMAGLCCGEPCTISWKIIDAYADAFLSCGDGYAARGMRLLARPEEGDPAVGQAIAMGRKAYQMIQDAMAALTAEDELAARKVIAADDAVDFDFNAIKHTLAQEIAADPAKVDAALDLLMVIKYLERIGDHAVNVAEWVQFVRTGRYKDESMF